MNHGWMKALCSKVTCLRERKDWISSKSFSGTVNSFIGFSIMNVVAFVKIECLAWISSAERVLGQRTWLQNIMPRLVALILFSSARCATPCSRNSRSLSSAVKRSIGSTTGCTITEKASPALVGAFTFKTLCQMGVDPTVSQCEIGSATQKVIRDGRVG